MTEPDVWDERVAGALRFLRRRLTGEYDVDEFGFDQELTDTLFQPVLRPLYRDWFRVEVRGRRTCRPAARPWWSRTTPAPSRSTP